MTQGDTMSNASNVIDALNNLLAGELTAMDLYLIQSRRLQDLGLNKLYERLNHEMDDERLHASQLIDRILYLGGTPDVKARHAFDPTGGPKEMLEEALRLEHTVSDNLNAAIKIARDAGDNGTRVLLEPLLSDTENDHILWLRTQLGLMDMLGMSAYLAEQM